MPPYIETILYIFSLIGLGYIAVATKYLKPEIGEGLTSFIYNVGVPLLLFKNILNADFGSGEVLVIWAVYFSAGLVVWTLSHLVVQFVFGRDTRAGVVAGVTGAFSNCVLVGIPFITGVYGEEGVAILSKILTIHLPVMLAATIIQFEWASRRDGAVETEINFNGVLKKFLKQLLSNPLVLGILAGFVVKMLAVNPPPLADRLIESISATVGPLALFAVGMATRRYGVSGQIPPALVLVSFKLMLMPAIVLGLSLVFGVPEFTTRVLVSIAALPVGINSWVVAQQFGTGQRLAATSITIGTATAVLSTGLWLLICDLIF
ncbi:MAG: AEC family transporter [Lentilitoribacter sp.]